MSQQDFSNWDNVRIAPRRDGQGDWTVADYKKLTFDTEEDWQTAVTIFEDRIREQFLNIADAIEDMPFAGFAVMALDCLLIETLNQFYHGVSETPRRCGEGYFVEFLTRPPFKDDFDDNKAKKFYDHVRNDILHQAETKENTRIRTDSEPPIVQLTPDEKGLIINRKKFHQKLKDAFEQYVRDLRGPKNSQIREHFRRKMDSICRIS